MAKKSVRNMKVCGQSGYQYKTIPSIMLKGQWLKDWGFEIDDAIVVKCEDGKLVVMEMVLGIILAVSSALSMK